MAEIEKLRVLHELDRQFEIPAQARSSIHAQLSDDDRTNINRFMSGFTIENWFAYIFSALSWTILIHGLEQEQFPSESKSLYQVPDFLTFIETSSKDHMPILVEVKHVAKQKQTLKLQESQVILTQKYANRFGMSLLYVVYWEMFNAWTVNTPDTFEKKTSSQKLSMNRALELDCSLIFGDVSFHVTKPLKRVLVYEPNLSDEPRASHSKYGNVVSDVISIDRQEYKLTPVESGALDSMFSWDRKNITEKGGATTISEEIDGDYVVKLSTWMTRHMAIFNITPTEKDAAFSAYTIFKLMEHIGIRYAMPFPIDRTEEIELLHKIFFQKTETP